MARTFDVSIESPVQVADILSAFGDEKYWHARLAAFGNGSAALSALEVAADGCVTVTVTLGLLRDRLPKVVTQVHRGDLEMVRTETWTPGDEGEVSGDIAIAVTGAPLSATGRAKIQPAEIGSHLTYSTTVAVKVPIVRGRIESFIGGYTVDEITRLQDFTTGWITGRL
ncbi:DUF2505 domain-containing protein [Mycolicibacterium litorale]|uniref:DUF2505 domain-containing protein n=1 Tax=Mycolicibacterium litorale TaxID=758802 RepID=A0AAD1MR63_9MYCO|nr:DUF2505 domain-containing protein [Mycolicibacterium litorale]TDY11592.1 uncharacterized protein DUF2505 [Mycolicibacterium litorale]BBY15884.1 hypothetical protein MLIT_14760 [Mycolicibacterium litorale]